jgi:hypothetical protein
VPTQHHGRHRAARRSRRLVLASLRPGERALKSAGLCLSGGGLLVALVAPSASADLELIGSATPGAPAAVTAEAAPAPEARERYGVIGFTAVAAPEPKPEPQPASAPEPTAERGAEPASRSVSYGRTGLAVENGLSPNAIAVLNAVRDEFPHLTEYGGVRAGDSGDHGSGHAVDIMTSTADGDAVAEYLQGRAGELGITYLIWKQRRWSPGGSWVAMEDRGSATANHYDHVHVSVS